MGSLSRGYKRCRTTSITSDLDRHSHTSHRASTTTLLVSRVRPRPTRPQKKVSSRFYRLLYVLISITPHTNIDELLTPPHPSLRFGAGVPPTWALHARRKPPVPSQRGVRPVSSGGLSLRPILAIASRPPISKLDTQLPNVTRPVNEPQSGCGKGGG